MKMSDEQIRFMVEKFLTWELPTDFSPDGGVSFDNTGSHQYKPFGTNLLNYQQALEMVRYIVLGLPE